jgi:hypothetical protein
MNSQLVVHVSLAKNSEDISRLRITIDTKRGMVDIEGMNERCEPKKLYSQQPLPLGKLTRCKTCMRLEGGKTNAFYMRCTFAPEQYLDIATTKVAFLQIWQHDGEHDAMADCSGSTFAISGEPIEIVSVESDY